MTNRTAHLDNNPTSKSEGSPDLDTRRRVLMELLKQKQAEAVGLLATYIRAYTVFLAITGAMLKFALDASSTPELRQALCALGLASCACAFLAAVFGEKLRRDTRSRIQELLAELHVDVEPDNLRGILYTTITATVLSLFILGGWIYVLVWPPRIAPAKEQVVKPVASRILRGVPLWNTVV